jgi:hypothetical protein
MEQPLGPLFEGMDGAGRIHRSNLPTDHVKGDLFISDGVWVQRLPVGEAGQVLVCDPTAPLGVRWVSLSPA